MPQYSSEQLKILKQRIDSYLDKNDPDYLERKEGQKRLENLIAQFNTAVDRLVQKNNGIDGSLVLDSDRVKEVLTNFVTKQIEPLLKEIREAIQGMRLDKVLQTKDETTASNLVALKRSIDGLTAKMEAIGKDDRQTKELTRQLEMLRDGVDQLALKDVKVPAFPSKITVEGLNRLEEKLNDVVSSVNSLATLTKKPPTKDRTDEIIAAIKALKIDFPDVDFPKSIEVSNFPPQKVPQPVTNININPLRGYVHTTAATVSTTLTPLPTYGVLNNRRSIMIFNNDDSDTVYIGGSDVTASNGLPVLAQTYSPVIDAGVRMILYGVVSSGSANVRVMEVSNDAIGG